nr:putative ribonuclease H-like domain-containing protein [Tanacetum cinerariifolium]
MHDKFQMSAMGKLTFFLGLQVLEKKDGIFLLQDKYVGDILKKFRYSDVRHQVTPKECHLHAVKRIFRYLKCHPKLGLWYPKESPFDLVAYSDSDYDGATHDRKSTTRGCQFLGRRLISWQCKKQTIVATSTTKAEYMEAASGCRQVLWIQNQMLNYGYNFMNTKIYIDNNSAICIVKIPVYHSKTKHIEIRHHFIRDCYEKKLISVNHIHTDDNVAELLTKPFDVGRFQYLVLDFCDYHNMVAILEKTKHNTDFHQIVDFIEASHIRHLKLNDKEGISSLPDTELFENLALMGYNILPNQRQGEAFLTVSSLDAGQDRENIAKTSALRHESSPRVTSLDADEGNQELEISGLKARVKSLEDKERRSVEPTQEDAPITRGIMEIGEELGADKSTELGSNDTEEMVNVLTLMEAANILTSEGAAASVSPTDVLPTVGVSTPMRIPIIGAKDKGKEKVIESEVPKKRKHQEQIDAQVAREIKEEFARENQRLSEQIARDFEIARIHAEEELKIMIEGLDRSNKVIAKHLREYEQAESKPLSKKEQREFYMSVLRSHAEWKTKHFRGMTLEQIKEKFIPVWKQLEDFLPMSSKKESEKVKRQGLKIDQGSSKRVKVSEGVSEQELKGMMQLVPLEEVYIKALQAKVVDPALGNNRCKAVALPAEGTFMLVAPDAFSTMVAHLFKGSSFSSGFKQLAKSCEAKSLDRSALPSETKVSKHEPLTLEFELILEMEERCDCRVTIRSKLKMIPNIQERISSSKKRLDLFKNTVFGKWVLYKDSVTIGHLGELVPDKAAKGKASQLRDKGDKVSVTIRDLGIVFSGSRGKKVVPTFMLRLVNDLAAWDDFPWGEYYWEDFHNKVFSLIDKRTNNHIEFKKENPSKLPTYTIHGFAWALKASICQDSNPTTKLQPTDAEMVQNWYRKSYDCLNSKEKSVQLDDFNVVSDHDDEFDSYTG